MIDYYDNIEAGEWIVNDLFYQLHHFQKKYGNASGSILYSFLILDEELMKVTPQLEKFQTFSVDPYTIFTMVAGEKTPEPILTIRINRLFAILNEHCPYEEVSVTETVLPQFTVIKYGRLKKVTAFSKRERSVEQQQELWNIFKILWDKDVPVAAFSKDIFDRCNNKFNGCSFSQFTIFMHHAVCEYFTPLTEHWRKFYYSRGLKKITYKWYAEEIGYHERNIEEMEESKSKYYLVS